MQADSGAGCPRVEMGAHAAKWLQRIGIHVTNEGIVIEEGSQVWDAVTKVNKLQHSINQRVPILPGRFPKESL